MYLTSQTQATCSWVKPKLGRGLCRGGGGLYGGVVPDPGAPYPNPADSILLVSVFGRSNSPRRTVAHHKTISKYSP